MLAELRARGLRIVVCSNWDWDLREAVAESGLTDAVDALVSSAWVGARKPHPRIYAAALAEAGVPAAEVLFVGDTWGPDVVGPVRGRIPAALPAPRRPLARRHRPARARRHCPRRHHGRRGPHRDPRLPRRTVGPSLTA